MTHPFDVLKLDNGATFIFTPCPGTKEADLTASIATLKSAGASAIVSLLTNEEISNLGVTELGHEIARQHLSWYQLPIEDDEAPAQPFFSAFKPVKSELLARIDKQETIAIHCRGGSGRTGLMAAILLLERGQPWQQVKTQIQSIRPKALTLDPHLQHLEKLYLS